LSCPVKHDKTQEQFQTGLLFVNYRTRIRTRRTSRLMKERYQTAVFSDLFYASLRTKITDEASSKSPVTFIYRKRQYKHELRFNENTKLFTIAFKR